jgi:hypothetical protein
MTHVDPFRLNCALLFPNTVDGLSLETILIAKADEDEERMLVVDL